ncbi:chemotaxis protein CheB [Pedobacter sp. ASV28]|uniref:chemotaxis protein CheB n=1 Tax=Pedobacter sp. ASV28 TaxID=2795123 RepID=UPI0018EA397B|nr:chemotaxis protein CheB [Pedobacter sp. ASV28]
MLSDHPSYIIAIGASAGGMEDINAFFDYTPLDGVSYVVIQHLSAAYKSHMVELLSRHSKLVVQEAKNGMTVRANQVYLIPNNKFMTIHDHCLYLTNKKSDKGPHLTINTFFSSLAMHSGKKAIGVILSGMGSDGAEGIRVIKMAGGLVIARNPETTEFGSMPTSAVNTGFVDFLLEPELMPGTIEEYVKYTSEAGAEQEDQENVEKYFKGIIDLIKEQLPMDFSDYKLSTLLRRTKRRAAYLKLTLNNYLEFLKVTPDEIEALARDFLISVTSFFRDRQAFDVINAKVLPNLLTQLLPGEELKIWIAGCATGEEAYSFAIMIAEQLTGPYEGLTVKIFATDIDSLALKQAGQGIYQAGITKDISAEQIGKYFIKEGENYRISPRIRQMVIFAQHDIARNPPYCNMHLISCRNLLIYMTPVLQKKIFSMLLFGLKMGGYLFLGTSENPSSIMNSLEVVDKKWRLYKNLKVKQDISFSTFSMPELLSIKRTELSRPMTFANMTNHTLAEAMSNALAAEQSYLAICVDENNQVLKSIGDTNKYLIKQNFNSDLVALLPKALAIAFITLRVKVLKTKSPVSVIGIKVKLDQKQLDVNLCVSPLILNKDGQVLLLVTFSEGKTDGVPSSEDKVFDEKVYYNKYTLNLEEELKEVRIGLNSAYEKLDASNENMQSFSEELISANEEMQSTNEEMQSVNEELNTINSDYQLKNKELSEVNDDLNNYFRSNLNGQLFVNKELLLMRFSPSAANQINLMETDIGRPLSQITTNIRLEPIIEDVKKILIDNDAITKEIETTNNRWYQIMIMPYVQQSDHKTVGAIITFNDITELKRIQLELDRKNESLLRINADLDRFVLTASHDLLSPLGNIEGSIGIINTLDASDPDIGVFINMIGESVKKFRELIKSLSTISKIENDLREQVDMEELIKNIEWSLEDRIRSAGAVIKCELEVKHILFSKKSLRSILYNLVSNAIKFRREELPVVHIKTVNYGDEIILSVEDNGAGMPENQLDKIFDMYGRLQKEIEGQGIGLYLAKKIVNAADGKIIVESALGMGSKFTIYLKN